MKQVTFYHGGYQVMNKKYHLPSVVLPLFITIILVACGHNDEVVSTDGEENDSRDDEPVTIQNGGRTVTFTEMLQRVVSLGSQSTEILLALGLEEYMVGLVTKPEQIYLNIRKRMPKFP